MIEKLFYNMWLFFLGQAIQANKRNHFYQKQKI